MNIQCLILACGNTLRSDDGIGPWLAAWAEERFANDPRVKVISRQQWTPDLAVEIARAESVLFIDCSIESAPGYIQIIGVEPSATQQGIATHHSGAAELLGMSGDLYDSLPSRAALLSVGAGSTDLSETFSEPVRDAIPHACDLLQRTVTIWLRDPTSRR